MVRTTHYQSKIYTILINKIHIQERKKNESEEGHLAWLETFQNAHASESDKKLQRNAL